MSLGLTYLQAKIYFTLTQLKTAEAQKISNVSNVARQDIYRLMPTLEKNRSGGKNNSNTDVIQSHTSKRGLLNSSSRKDERACNITGENKGALEY
jgi:hypothetical protein